MGTLKAKTKAVYLEFMNIAVALPWLEVLI
jgi:hypothetical protein